MTYVVYQETERQKLGSAIADFMTTSSLWPDSLVDYYENLSAKQKSVRKGRTLVVWMLQEWMAQETGLDILMTPKFEKLLTRYSQWDSTPARAAGDSFILMCAIAQCGICFDEHGQRITDSNDLVKFLLGLPILSPAEKAAAKLQNKLRRVDD